MAVWSSKNDQLNGAPILHVYTGVKSLEHDGRVRVYTCTATVRQGVPIECGDRLNSQTDPTWFNRVHYVPSTVNDCSAGAVPVSATGNMKHLTIARIVNGYFFFFHVHKNDINQLRIHNGGVLRWFHNETIHACETTLKNKNFT